MDIKNVNKNNAQPAWRRFAAVAALFAFGATAGCSLFGTDGVTAEKEDRHVDKEIWHMRDMFVRLEPQDKVKGAPPPPNQHPVNITSDQLYNAFSQMTIKSSDKTGYVPLFTEFELSTLSQQISTGLAEAQPSEDVTFAIIGWHKGGGGLFTLASQQVTTGRVFYQGGQVNLILGTAHRDVDTGESYATREAESGDRRLDPFVPGMRGFTQEHSWQLAAAPSAGVYGAPGGRRSDWLVFSATALAAAPPPASDRPSAASPAEQARYEQLQQQVNQLQQQLQTMQKPGATPAAAYPAQPAQPAYPGYQAPAYPGYQAPAGQGYAAPAAPQGAAAQPPQAPGQSPSGGESVEQRLLVLDDLKNKGLISEAEYQQKRSQILSGY